MIGREHCCAEELEAHQILDLARAGADIPSATIKRALWVTGDAVGTTNYFESETAMTLLHINEPRCAGRDTKHTPTICPNRNTCIRHKQLDTDRKMGLDALQNIRILNLPYVPGQSCTYRLPA